MRRLAPFALAPFALARFTLALTALALAAGPALADPVEGLWQTKPDDNGNVGYIQIAPCGAKLCGTLVKSFDKAGKAWASPNIGKQIVWDMVAQGGGAYGEGKVWAPDRNKTYISDMQLHGAELDVRGCVMFCSALTSRAQTWMRVK